MTFRETVKRSKERIGYEEQQSDQCALGSRGHGQVQNADSEVHLTSREASNPSGQVVTRKVPCESQDLTEMYVLPWAI